jgi:hypothetical protein
MGREHSGVVWLFDSLNNQQFWFFKNLGIERTSGSEGRKT